jgi:hypothetical protein
MSTYQARPSLDLKNTAAIDEETLLQVRQPKEAEKVLTYLEDKKIFEI